MRWCLIDMFFGALDIFGASLGALYIRAPGARGGECKHPTSKESTIGPK